MLSVHDMSREQKANALGVPPDRIANFHRHKGGYAKGVAPLPTAFQRLIHAHPITIGASYPCICHDLLIISFKIL